MSEYIRLKVRGYHLDQHGYLNYLSIMQVLEEARWALFDTNNAVDFFTQREQALTLVNTNINYRRPGMLNEVLEIHTKVMCIGTASCRMEQTIYLDGSNEVIAQAEHTFVLMDKIARTAIPIAGEARKKLEQLANAG